MRKFDCTQCGKCCEYRKAHGGVYDRVFIPEEYVPMIANYLEMTRQEFIAYWCHPLDKGFYELLQGNGHCVFYDPEQKACTIYPVRPPQCYVFPFWEHLVDDDGNLLDIAMDVCEGITDDG